MLFPSLDSGHTDWLGQGSWSGTCAILSLSLHSRGTGTPSNKQRGPKAWETQEAAGAMDGSRNRAKAQTRRTIVSKRVNGQGSIPCHACINEDPMRRMKHPKREAYQERWQRSRSGAMRCAGNDWSWRWRWRRRWVVQACAPARERGAGQEDRQSGRQVVVAEAEDDGLWQ